MKALPWLKLWTEVRRDAKLARVEPAWRWVWIALLTLAQESNAGGKILNVLDEPMDDEEIARECGVDLVTWRAAKAYFGRVKVSAGGTMLTTTDGAVTVTMHAKRQATDPGHAARQAQYRKRQSDASRDGERDASRDGTEHRASEHQRTEDRASENRLHSSDKASSSSSRRNGKNTPARAVHDDDDAGHPSDASGMLLPPGDFTAEQRVAWEQVLATASNFDHADQFVRAHDPLTVTLYAMLIGERDNVFNPAGLLRNLVDSGTPPPARTEHRTKYWSLVTAARGIGY